ncbi:peptidoglycan/xylan/chitin deacetylase (PgdA/CDA1 family) [Bacillus tianshenii]|uniref:Peptidoglycan/xylan/chitin deacetylase (PgdA/CDA1 family) n=1 Tax=Sutcliffiella tianshenii TaxID=1463404 RepID=A0ABS2P4F5_9BACI|nr:polysaccharide deacetylase family protein [Bacillus tianshenii]MBM7621754.1 peptidoglycan/xylan/chitin deacetylase (PgdA/CDA1 family) [Bacillus tianshenii]
MKKWIVPTLLMLLLTACAESPQNENSQADEGETATESNQNNDNDEGEVSETQEDSEGVPEEEEGSENAEEATTAPESADSESEEPQYTVNPADSSVQPIGEANAEVVLLTIDDAPDRYAMEMATTLKELGVKAIFFVNGHFLQTEEEKETLKKIHEMGFPIGNHTMNHKSLRQLTEEEQYEEIVGLNDLIEEIIGEQPKFFRAPFGINTDYSDELVASEGMVRMNWTYGYDWEQDYTTADAIADIMVNAKELRSGANLLMHDREWTNAALADIVKGLQDKGYEMLDPSLIEVKTDQSEL